MKSEILELFDREINQSITTDYKKIISFIDAAISQAFKYTGDDRAEFLIKNMLNIRDFMSSAVIVEQTKVDIKDNVVKLFDNFVNDHDLDLKELESILIKKKEKLKDEDQNQERTLEKDPLTLQKEEEK
tara:strand:+ start:197 stop:583 length:387 start_codon:yes stop_codon:yes gene_type:complete